MGVLWEGYGSFMGGVWEPYGGLWEPYGRGMGAL